MRFILLALSLAGMASPLTAQQLPRAIFTDPPHDAKYPARMVVLHISSGEVRINGVAYLAGGPGLHPTFVLLHGLPGNEKNFDLAQAVRRAGWNAITMNYRGSWGSPGSFRFAYTLEDADAVVAYLRDTANVRALAIDTTRMVLAGHSMGGWVTAMTAAHDHDLRGAILISAVNMGRLGQRGDTTRVRLVETMRDNMESLAGVTVDEEADELIANAEAFNSPRARQHARDDGPRRDRSLLVRPADRARGARASLASGATALKGSTAQTRGCRERLGDFHASAYHVDENRRTVGAVTAR